MNKKFRVFSSTIVSGAIALVVLFATTAVFASSPQGSFERTLQVSGPVDLDVQTHSGDITVRAGSSGSVTIRGKIHVNNSWFSSNREGDIHSIEQNPPIHQSGNSIRVENVDMRNISIDYEITVPSDTAVRSRSGSGNQTIEGTKGNSDIQTGSGDIKLSNLTGDIHVQTGSGNVRAQSVSGPIHGGTGSGDIEIAESGSGDVELHTGSGNITARGVSGGFRGETGSGDITAEGTQTGSWEMQTGSGNVRVHLPGDAKYDADISTSSGSIDVDAPVETTVQGRVGDSHKSVHGKVRGGGQLLRVRTGSGDIHVG